ncbi:MAG: thymidylate synthase [Dolichospermum sp.]
MNNLDKQYTDLLQTILEHGVDKKDRTGTGTKSIFGYTIRHNMKDGFPLLTTKKMPFKTIVTELLWFLRGDTNIKFLVDNNCHIWDGDAYKNYINKEHLSMSFNFLSQEEFINKIKTNDEFAKKWGELGPIYGKQWRQYRNITPHKYLPSVYNETYIDQIQNLINDLKENPDSRRLMVNAWNVGELDQMVLPPCHYGFQVYTRELTWKEQVQWVLKNTDVELENLYIVEEIAKPSTPKRAISLMWNQRSVDTFLGLPFNIASYGLLLEIIAKEVNMVPDQLIGNLGDVHLYSNHLEQAKEQIGRKYAHEERTELLKQAMGAERYERAVDELMPFGGGLSGYYESYGIPYNTREPYPLPKLNFNTEWWDKPLFEAVKSDAFCKCLLEEDVQLSNYQAHPTIKAPLSN